MTDLVQARWLCGYPVEVQGQGIIEPGGLAMIPAAEAEHSDHWEGVKTPAARPKPTTEETI